MNYLVVWQDLTLFWGSNPRSITAHQHPVVQLVIGVNQPFLSKDKQGKWQEKRALLIGPNVQHECDAQHIEIMTLTVDPDSSLGEWVIGQYLHIQSLVELPLQQLDSIDLATWKNQVICENYPELRCLINAFFAFEPWYAKRSKLDERVRTVVDFISSHIESPIDTKTLMSITHLSESRLLHLFKAEMGLPIRNYILWYRLQLRLRSIMDGHNLTQAAYEAGFSDQAHLTRTFVKMLGIPPSVLTKNSKFVQVSLPQLI